MPSAPPAQRPRSAEQTARLLLSNAFRYDTWECAAARKDIKSSGVPPKTLRIAFDEFEKQSLSAVTSSGCVAVNLALFEPQRKMFVGATHRVNVHDLTKPLVVQASPTQVLVVELLTRDTRATAGLEEYRVLAWGSTAVEQLATGACRVPLRQGTAHLLLVEEAAWPQEAQTASATEGLSFHCAVNADAALAQLMTQLVPPGVVVGEEFTKATPQPGSRTFNLVIKNVELAGSSSESVQNLSDPDADWSLAAVAHNGYQQLGSGKELPFVLDETVHTTTTTNTARSSSRTSSSYGYSSSSRSSSSTRTSDKSSHRGKGHGEQPAPKGKKKASSGPSLRTELPLEIAGLPVHSATSLVMALRRRPPGARAYQVMGFCVLPLCMMPMQDRDVRVENLPALRGPFSCEDARLLMVDSASPYGRLPIAMTLTVEYHDTGVSSAVASPPTATAAVATPEGGSASAAATAPQASASTPPTSEGAGIFMDGSEELPAPSGAVPPPPLPAAGGQILSTAEAAPVVGPGGLVTVSAPVPAPAVEREVDGGSRARGDDVGIFKLLCTIMEELQHVREAQDAMLSQLQDHVAGRGAMSPAMMDRLSQKLADCPLDVIDLAPRPIAVSWQARKKMQEHLQPIMHPTKGTLLDDATPAIGQLAASLYGFRIEGVTLDTAIKMPEDLCLMFSFGPMGYQQHGPLHATSVGTENQWESFQIFDDQRGGFVWCEPTESIRNVAVTKYKSGASRSATLYLHLYDALTMFYVATAMIPLAAFRRPYSSEAALIPMDLALQRDLSMTEQVVPPRIYPVMRQAGQLHLTLFCVGVGADLAGSVAKPATMRLPQELLATGGRVITAKKLPHADRLISPVTDLPPAAEGSATSPPPLPSATSSHWQRADYFKQMLAEQRRSEGAVQVPGVPEEHVKMAQENAELEFKLRHLEREREALKSQRIADMLMQRLTVEHEVHTVAWRPEVLRTPFQNPYGSTMQFFVHVDVADTDVCMPVDCESFYLGPRERTEVTLAVRMAPSAPSSRGEAAPAQVITVKVYTEKREVAQRIRITATVAPPIVDRRYEIFGAPGTTVAKKVWLRTFSSASFPADANQAALLTRMRELCAYAATSSEETSVDTNAVLDPITQSYITAWEEATIHTAIPAEVGKQRVEYVTIFHDKGLSRVYETWELCVFACESVVTREIAWGQTTMLGLPAEGTEDLYCSDAAVRVERRGASYVLRLHPREVGSQQMLLHTLQSDVLKKTLLTVPTVFPTPTFSQVIELGLADMTGGPIFRRLTFVHRGEREEVFQVHHNYKFNLRLSPTKFALAPGDSQFVTLQLDMLSLPAGQTEGRWPMWIFINNGEDKTVESYYLQIVLRAHPVAPVAK